ncbi:uncharacterized protein JCM6883_006539 [Sporobolomyces salmoneus]|uniref:uncharacterized protein n=1 Tax=Sporobolomyces salmoneus TaxID=183962 RepID=UPI00316FEE75
MARNSDVSPYIGKLSRSKVYAKKGLYKRQPKSAAPAEGAAAKAEEPAYYPGDDVRQPKVSRKSIKPAKLRSSIVPGTVVILLAGRFRGKRVVVLGQLPSGLLLVTGPFKINGVPLRRVNQAYVIATSTKLDAKFNDAYFAKEKTAKRSGTEGEFFKDGEKEKKAFPAEKAADQKSVDKAIISAVAGVPNLSKYLSATFGLTKGQYPHLLKFVQQGRTRMASSDGDLAHEPDESTYLALPPRSEEEGTAGSTETTSVESRPPSPSPSTVSSCSFSSFSTAPTPEEIEVRDTSRWPSGGFEPSWMESRSSSDEIDDDDSFHDVEHFTLVTPRQPFNSIRRLPLEPLLPQRFNSPSVFLDPDRSGYRITSISLGNLDDRTFHRFAVERRVPIDNGRLALLPGGGGGLALSGYGFEYDSAFHLTFPPGSVQALHFLQSPVSPHRTAPEDEVDRISLIVSTWQTPIFRASTSSRNDFVETSTPRVSALDEEHCRLVPYLSQYFLIELSFAKNEIFNPFEPLPSSFENFLFDLDQLEGFPSPTYLDSTNFSVDRVPQSEYSQEVLERLSTSFGEFDSPSLTFPLEWIVRDATLTPDEVLLLIKEHVRAWEVTADYDEHVVEEILYELRTTLVEKSLGRFNAYKRKESKQENERFKFEGVEKEAEFARQKVLERRKAGNADLLGGGKTVSGRRKGSRKVTEEDRRKRNLYWSKSVVVTPSGSIRVQGKNVDKTNSVIRSNFDGVDHFLRVSFKEEDGLQLSTVGGTEAQAQHELFEGSIARILKDGLIFGGRKFEFLSYSQASLREASAIFLAPFPSTIVRNGIRSTRLIDAAQVRASMGHFEKCSFQPAMLGARWSQRFTTTSGLVVLRDHQIHRIEDIVERDAEGNKITCHTDGAGLLSPKLRDELCKALIENGYRLSSIAPFPSVFQIRLGGYKGILAVDNTQEGEGVGIAVRPSQEKFFGLADSDTGDSFVLNIAKAFDRPRPLRLNRPLISALEDLGIEPSVFLRYQRKAVASLTLPRDASVFRAAHIQLVSSSLGGPSGFHQLLKSFAQLDQLPLSLLRDEPFLRQALDVVRIRVLRSYKYHASIPLPDCRLLVGVPDEDGILEEDEVYIALRDPQSPDTVEYIEGRIAITRSPTIDAGDVRIVNAIGRFEGVSRLTSSDNCIVFPTKGKRSLSSMMGGGDLDGDTYQIITLPDLIPDKTFPPLSHAAQPPLELDRPATIDDVADCFVHYIENNMVGAIATRHLFVADKSPQHGRDPIAIKLAELHSHSVDSPKTGRVVKNEDLPRMPDYLRRERPDFLQPENREYALDLGYYNSTRALGQLYRDIDYEQIKIPQELVNEENVPPLQQRDGQSSAFKKFESIVDERITTLLGTTISELESDSRELRPSSLELRTSFCSFLRDLATVHSFPRTGGRKLSEVEIFAVTNLATSTRDTVARGNAVVAMGTQLESLVEWLKRQLGSGTKDGIGKMRAAWKVGIEEKEEDWQYGARAFGWICLSILLENLLRFEGETEKEKEGPSTSKVRQENGKKKEKEPVQAQSQAQDLVDSDSPLSNIDSTARSPPSVVFKGLLPPKVEPNPKAASSLASPARPALASADRNNNLPPTPSPSPSTRFQHHHPLSSQSLSLTPHLPLIDEVPPPPPPPPESRSHVVKSLTITRSTPQNQKIEKKKVDEDTEDVWQTERMIERSYSAYSSSYSSRASSSSATRSFGGASKRTWKKKERSMEGWASTRRGLGAVDAEKSEETSESSSDEEDEGEILGQGRSGGTGDGNNQEEEETKPKWSGGWETAKSSEEKGKAKSIGFFGRSKNRERGWK